LAATKDVFKRAWELASSETAALLCAAEKPLGALDGVELGSHRELTVAEALLWTEMCGPRFAAKVAVFVGATSSSDHSPFTRLMQKVKVLRLLKYAERSVTAFLGLAGGSKGASVPLPPIGLGHRHAGSLRHRDGQLVGL
jgi:hypothetical protein